MKKTIETIRAQCSRCGLVGDRKQYSDGTYTQRCPHCGRRTYFSIIK